MLIGMRVLNCIGDDFVIACQELADYVRATFAPDVIVGVHRGGAVIAQAFRDRGVFNAEFATVSAARLGTHQKGRLSPLLRHTPRFAADILRRLEHRARVRRFEAGVRVQRSVHVPDETARALRRASRVLIVDDAVDTGETLRAVTERVKAASTAEVRTAALTVTFTHPLVSPHFSLHQGVLLRFPWSSDARQDP